MSLRQNSGMKARCTRDDKSTNRMGKVGGRNRTTVEVMTGPDRWNKQPMGLTVVAIKVEARRLRPEALPQGPFSGNDS
jgi:hypothetical protein